MPAHGDLAVNRRDFLRLGVAGGALAIGPLARGLDGRAGGVCLVVDPADPIAGAAPVRWALDECQRAFEQAGSRVRRVARMADVPPEDVGIVAGSAGSAFVAAPLRAVQVAPPAGAEQFVLAQAPVGGRDVVLAAGADARGVMYAVLELADRVSRDTRAVPPAAFAAPVAGRPANPVRSVMRQFTSETLDLPWFRDRAMWPEYLAMLARARVNRLHLAFGLGYDSLQRVEDSYALFLYPFLLDVPGYHVRATNLPDAERDRNLETLRFISDAAVAHGIDFQLGIWMHGYVLANSPNARYLIEGLTPETHAAYCRDALTAVLKACPSISAVGLRIHGESGIAEGSYAFWRTIFDGVRRADRRIEIDLHAKGIDQTMIDGALGTGLPVNLSPKFWAEHLGLPYHQAAIRELEMPVAGRRGAGLMTLSEGSRVFTRYGYADLLRDDRAYTVRFRVFSGTQRILLSVDPEWTAAYARRFQFCGTTGADLMEPLTCRGRRGTGAIGGRRDGYIDASLATKWDWEKYADWYRTWGRLMYDPDEPAEVAAGAPASPAASALAQASRLLPIVTTAHLPSAACDAYWPEIGWNQPMAVVPRPNPYGDTPSPKTFRFVSPLDPQLFATIDEWAGVLLSGEPSAKYSPVDAARWIETLAAGAERDLARGGNPATAAARRAAIDVALQVAVGRFFAAKFRAGVLYAIHARTGDRRAFDEAVAAYRRARTAWAAAVDRAAGVYAADLSVSDRFSERGQWRDRLAAIDADIASLSPEAAPDAAIPAGRVDAAIRAALATTAPPVVSCSHTPPSGVTPGAAVPLALDVEAGPGITHAVVHYRLVNQAERWEQAAMRVDGRTCHGTIPAGYTASPYRLQYYFEVRDDASRAWLWPGLTPALTGQPYYVVGR
jgi:hypothetical protein